MVKSLEDNEAESALLGSENASSVSTIRLFGQWLSSLTIVKTDISIYSPAERRKKVSSNKVVLSLNLLLLCISTILFSASAYLFSQQLSTSHYVRRVNHYCKCHLYFVRILLNCSKLPFWTDLIWIIIHKLWMGHCLIHHGLYSGMSPPKKLTTHGRLWQRLVYLVSPLKM